MIGGLLSVAIAYEWRWTGPKVNINLCFLSTLIQPNGSKNLSPGAIHTLFGALACILAFIQPFLAWFRCSPSHAKRETFNIVHRALGIISWIFAGSFLKVNLKFYQDIMGNVNFRNSNDFEVNHIFQLFALELLVFTLKSDWSQRILHLFYFWSTLLLFQLLQLDLNIGPGMSKNRNASQKMVNIKIEGQTLSQFIIVLPLLL